MKLQLAYYGDPVLRQKGALITEFNDELRQIVADMIETMHASDGIGLAAPQVFKSLALFVTCVPTYMEDETVVPGVERVFINPKILSYSDEVEILSEACLSIPKLHGHVMRPIRIVVEAKDVEGKTFTGEFIDYEARCIMHENDHINGKLYIDRMDPKERQEIEQQLREIKKKLSNKKKS